MKLLAYKLSVFILLLLFLVIGFLPIMFPASKIHPFIFAPEVGIEVYNYVSGLCTELSLLFLFAIIALDQEFISRINIDQRLNNLVKKSTQDIRNFFIAGLVYQFKEVFDFVAFYNMAPKWLDFTWYVLWWEFFPLLLIFLVAAWKSNYLTMVIKRNGTKG